MYVYIYFRALNSTIPGVAVPFRSVSVTFALVVMHFKKYDASKVLLLKLAGPVKASKAQVI